MSTQEEVCQSYAFSSFTIHTGVVIGDWRLASDPDKGVLTSLQMVSSWTAYAEDNQQSVTRKYIFMSTYPPLRNVVGSV